VNAVELTCKEMVEIVTDYLEGAMSEEDRSRFQRHLATCEGCTGYLRQMRETIRLTGMLTEDRIPEGQKEQLLVAFRGWKRLGRG
jgi:anti-sigma factor RsiW